MKQNEIKIIIVGTTGSGKSTIAHLIKKTLKNIGVNVIHNPLPDYKNEAKFDKDFNQDKINKIMPEIIKTRTVYLNEEQAKKEYYEN